MPYRCKNYMSLSDFCELVSAYPEKFLYNQMGEELQKRFEEVFPQFAEDVIKPYTPTYNTVHVKSKSEKIAEVIGIIIGLVLNFWIIFVLINL